MSLINHQLICTHDELKSSLLEQNILFMYNTTVVDLSLNTFD